MNLLAPAFSTVPVLGAWSNIFAGVVVVAFVLLALLMTFVILIQEGKGGGIAGAFGGAAAESFGVKAGSVNRFTAWLAGLFIGLAVVYGAIMAYQGQGVLDFGTPATPTTPAGTTPLPPGDGTTPPVPPTPAPAMDGAAMDGAAMDGAAMDGSTPPAPPTPAPAMEGGAPPTPPAPAPEPAPAPPAPEPAMDPGSGAGR